MQQRKAPEWERSNNASDYTEIYKIVQEFLLKLQ